MTSDLYFIRKMYKVQLYNTIEKIKPKSKYYYTFKISITSAALKNNVY